MQIKVNGNDVRFALHIGWVNATRKEREYKLKFDITTERKLTQYEQEKLGDVIFEAIRNQLYKKESEDE